MSEDKILLTVEQATSMLPDGDMVHTFRSGPGIALGADWERKSLIATIEKSPQRELGGEFCQGMKHGLVVWTVDEDDGRKEPLFVQCKKDFDYEAFEAELNKEQP